MIHNGKSANVIKAIYKHGVFEPVEPIQGLFDDQPVQLQIWPVPVEEVAFPEILEELDIAEDREWAALSTREQQGRRVSILTPEEEMSRFQWVQAHWASICLPSDQALEIATADWLSEENLNL
jgi:hypothetical protein